MQFATIAGPQLVVPVNNARYAPNAANARWGSLYDALYGTDAISDANGTERAGDFSAGSEWWHIPISCWMRQLPWIRGAAPMSPVTHSFEGALKLTLSSGSEVGLNAPQPCVCCTGDAANLTSILLQNNGLQTLTDTVPDAKEDLVTETYLDALIPSLLAMHDLKKDVVDEHNSHMGSIYIVKPKQHGFAQVELSVKLFAKVEKALGLPVNTVKMGSMDEERRCQVKAACV